MIYVIAGVLVFLSTVAFGIAMGKTLKRQAKHYPTPREQEALDLADAYEKWKKDGT